jgi:hypothetical protein
VSGLEKLGAVRHAGGNGEVSDEGVLSS